MKYGKFWSVSLELFIEHKLWNWEECLLMELYWKNSYGLDQLKYMYVLHFFSIHFQFAICLDYIFQYIWKRLFVAKNIRDSAELKMKINENAGLSPPTLKNKKKSPEKKESTCTTILPISEFVLDEKFQRNTSKFAIFYIYENPKLLFPFFISCYFIFPLINALVYVNIDQGIH